MEDSKNNISSKEHELRLDNQTIGKSTQKYAQVINFTELANILTQNVGKTSQKTYIQYTKEKLLTYLSNPISNIDNIRDISQYLYRISPNYRTIISYYSTMLLYSYNVVFHSKDWNKATKSKDFLSKYQQLCKRLSNMNLKVISSQAIATCFRDGIYVGFTYDDEDSFFINSLDPKYCKISAITEKNTYIVNYNAAFFDAGNNKEFLYGINNDGEGTWDQIFIDGYENYKKQGRDFQWFELPPERTLCLICGDDPTTPLPMFLSIFQSLLDLLDYQDLIRSKTELENTVLLLSKIPLLNKSDSVNDFAVDLDLVRLTQQMIDSVVPDLVGTAFSACDVEPIFFNNNDQVQDTNIFSQAVTNFFESIGVSQMLFSSEKGGSVGLRHSIRVDESLMFNFLEKMQANIQRYIKLNITEEFEFYFHKVSIFGQDEYVNSLRELATLGVPCKTDLATIYKSPLDVMDATLMENALNLNELWKPLDTSYTQSGSSNVTPKKSDDDLTEEGQDTRDSNKNEGTKSK